MDSRDIPVHPPREQTLEERVHFAHIRHDEHQPTHEQIHDRLMILERYMGRVFPEFRAELEEMLNRPKAAEPVEKEGPSVAHTGRYG